HQPDYPMVHLSIAQSLLAEHAVDYSAVLQELAEAERRSPTDFDVFYLRGKAYASMNNLEQAAATLQRAIDLRPADPGPYYQLGRIYQRLGRPDLAKQQFERMQFFKAGDLAP